jgi:hypothetical protein
MERIEIAGLGIDKLVVGPSTQILNVLYCPGIGVIANEKDNLCFLQSQFFDNCGADAGCSSLHSLDLVAGRSTVTITTRDAMCRKETFVAPEHHFLRP